MNTKTRLILILSLVLLGGMALWTMWAQAAPWVAPLAGGSPTVVSYQGEVRVSGTPYAGDGFFKFAVVNAAGDTTYWSNDGSSTGGGEPTAAVTLVVSEGLFSVLLGDTTLAGMTQPLTAEVFSQPDRYLRVWFSTTVAGPFDQLAPDTRIAAAPYALQAQAAVDADTVDGLHASELGTHYQNVVVVAKSDGDYTSVQAAIDSISDAGADNPYLVWVAPGVYNETVMMKPYVHLQGAGQEATVITSTASSGSVWPPTQATLTLASDTSLRDLTLGNSGTGDIQTALLATGGVTRTLVADVTARAQGNGVSNLTIFLSDSGTGVTLQGVTALAENGSDLNAGLINYDGAAVVLRGGEYIGRGGGNGWGIFNVGNGAGLEAENVTALGENGSNTNNGLYNYNGATAVLRGGDYTGRGGNQTGGVANALNSTLTAYGVTALAENGGGEVGNYAMGCYDNSTATLHGGVFIARGGLNNYALSNELNVTMKAENVTALAENGSNSNHGLWNVNNAKLVLHGASLTGRGGTYAYGIYSADSGTMLEAESVTALGESGSSANYGLYNDNSAVVVLRGGSFTALGGVNAWGIDNSTSATLDADSITALGENGSISNYGLTNHISATATLRGGSFTGRGGQDTNGISNSDSGTMLGAESVTALGENGSNLNHGLYNFSGAVTTLRSSSFTARGGTFAFGIRNRDSSTKLETDNVTALGNSNGTNCGLYNYGGATATLRDGAFIGREGNFTYGINITSGSTLEAENVIALGENSIIENFGLFGTDGVTSTLRGGSFIARGGTTARGIYSYGSSTTLEAEGVTALGDYYGLYNIGNATSNVAQSVLGGTSGSVYSEGTVTISNSRLVGNAVYGTVTCVLVTRGTTISTDGSTCP